MFISGGISSVIWSEISFYGDASAEPLNVISDGITDDIPPQMNSLNIVIPILMHFLTFIRQRHSILHQTSFVSNVKQLGQQITSDVTYDVGAPTVYRRIY